MLYIDKKEAQDRLWMFGKKDKIQQSQSMTQSENSTSCERAARQ